MTGEPVENFTEVFTMLPVESEEERERLRLVHSGGLESMPWRVGTSIPRNVYAQVGALPSKRDIDIGRFDTEALARLAVDDHNRILILKAEQRTP